MIDEEQEREVEAAARDDLARYREAGPGALTTLQLRAALHAADREGDAAAVRELAAIVEVREARETSR